MNELQIFNNPDFGQVRMVMIEDTPYFVGKDVAKILGYKNPNEAIQDHVDVDDKFLRSSKGSEMLKLFSSVKNIQDKFGRQDNWFINESGVYALVFGSKLPDARKFKHWVTSEVLPSIRKTGGYKVEAKPMDDMEILCRAVLISDKRIKALENKIELDAPKVAYADYASASKDSILIRDFCHGLPKEGFKIGERKLYALLVKHKVLTKKPKGYDISQKYANAGYFERPPRALPVKVGEAPKIRFTVYITAKGQIWLLNKLKEWYTETTTQLELAF